MTSSAAPPAPAATEGDPTPRWPAWSAPAALVAAFGGALLAGIVVLVGAAATGVDVQHPPPGVAILSTYLEDAAMIAAALFFARLTARLHPAQFGLTAPRVGLALRWIALAAVAYYAFALVWQAALKLHQKDDLPHQLGADRSTAALVAVAVLVCVIAPIAEEVLFRGFFFPALSGWRGPWIAAAITGVVFGAVHAVGSPLGFLVPLAFLGFVLCVLRWRTASLYPGIALHAANNGLALGVLEHWSAAQVALLMFGGLASVFAIVLPVARFGARAAARASKMPAS
ncbi:MAG: protease family protein [Solirubrobacteraceae bacterium]|nr:protease family protein [Solirubrobacteraceae bacterium]